MACPELGDSMPWPKGTGGFFRDQDWSRISLVMDAAESDGADGRL